MLEGSLLIDEFIVTYHPFACQCIDMVRRIWMSILALFTSRDLYQFVMALLDGSVVVSTVGAFFVKQRIIGQPFHTAPLSEALVTC